MHALNERLEQLYREHRQSMFTCALAITRNAPWAEDAVHEAFIRLLQIKLHFLTECQLELSSRFLFIAKIALTGVSA